ENRGVNMKRKTKLKRILLIVLLLTVLTVMAGCGKSVNKDKMNTLTELKEQGYSFSAAPKEERLIMVAVDTAEEIRPELNVTVTPEGEEESIQAVYSSHTGYYSAVVSEEGTYNITIAHDGYDSAYANAQVKDDRIYYIYVILGETAETYDGGDLIQDAWDWFQGITGEY
ncbi:MAG: hypothetical protein ACI4V6_00700, partial [Dorea sp.]